MRRLIHKLWHLFGTAFSFAFFGVWGTCLAWIVLPIVERRCEGDAGEKAMACRRAVSASLRFLFGIMCWFSIFDFSNRPTSADLPDDKRFVLIANHPSLVDMVALLSCFPELVVVAKTTMFNNPLLGPILRRCNFIDGGDGGVFSGASVVTAAVERLRAGTPVLIFPEGTRSGWRGFGTFRQGGFEMATRADVPLLPAFITTRPRTLMKGMPWYRIPTERVTIRIEIGGLIHAEPDESARQLKSRVQAVYERRLTELGMVRDDAAQPSALPGETGDKDNQQQAEESAA